MFDLSAIQILTSSVLADNNQNLFIALLLLHVGVWIFQLPEVWHVLELDPDLEYPLLHEKEALVSRGYLPFTGDLL